MDYTRYTKGLYIIGKLTEFSDGETIAYFLSPEGQKLIRETFMEHAKRAREADEDGGGVATAYDGEEAFKRLDDLVRYRLQQVIDKADEEAEEETQTQARKASESRHQPHAAGTVAEIAAKLGVSKSEVRKMKREGNLDAALKTSKDSVPSLPAR